MVDVPTQDAILELARKAYKNEVWAEMAAGNDSIWHGYIGPVQHGMLAVLDAAAPALMAAAEHEELDQAELDRTYDQTEKVFEEEKGALDHLLL